MNLKYYLRGLGLGIVITAVLLGITAGSRKEALSDEVITTKAKALGMIEESELSEYVEQAKADAEAELRETLEAELRISLQEEMREEAESAARSQETEGESEEQAEEGAGSEETEPVQESIEFTVHSGEKVKDISERLEEAGLVESASEFEKFLLGNGYDRSVVAYKYHIPAGADEEQIAAMLTGQQVGRQ